MLLKSLTFCCALLPIFIINVLSHTISLFTLLTLIYRHFDHLIMLVKHFLYPTYHITLLTIFHFTHIPLPHKPWTHSTLYLHYLFILIHHHPRKDQPIPTSPHVSPMNIHRRLKPRRIIYRCLILIKRVL